MNEKIILANGANEAELLRTLSKYGVNTFNTRVLNSSSLAALSLIKSGLPIPTNILSSDNIAIVLLSLLSTDEVIQYFNEPSFLNSKHIVSSFKTMKNILINDVDIMNFLDKSIFKDKSDALRIILYCFNKFKSEEKVFDEEDFIKYAILKSSYKFDEITILSDFENTLLDNELAKHLTDNIKIASLSDFIEKQSNKSELFITSARGKINEVLDAFKTIRDKKIKFDECLFVTLDDSYDKVIQDISNLLDIKYTSSTGIPITDTYPFKLYYLYLKWNFKEFNNVDSLKAMINSPYFDKKKMFGEICENDIDILLNDIGRLKISYNKEANNDKLKDFMSSSRLNSYFDRFYKDSFGLKDLDHNSYISLITKVINELSLDEFDFIHKYTIIREIPINLDKSALNLLEKKLHIIDSIEEYSKKEFFPKIKQEFLDDLFSKYIDSRISEPAKLHISNLDRSFNTIRKNVFIFGLSSGIFPGTIKEDYIFLDSEYENIDVDVKYHKTSTQILKNKVEKLKSLIKVSKSFGSNIYLSYSMFDISEIKSINYSSTLFEIYNEWFNNNDIDKFNDYIRVVDSYFLSNLFNNDLIGLNHINNISNLPSNTKNNIKNNYEYLFINKYSPSAIEKALTCPLRFLYERLYGLKEQIEDNPFEIISAIDFGNLVHFNMELLKMDKDITKENFLEEVLTNFDDYIKTHYPLNKDKVSQEKKLYKDMMSNEFDIIKNYTILETEKNIDTYYLAEDVKLRLGGRLDCLAMDKDSKYVIVDYKTGKNINHKENDPSSCFQALLYAYMLEKEHNIIVDRCEYHYIRYGKIVACDYLSLKTNIESLLNEFVLLLKNLNFNKINKTKICQYCDHEKLCKELKNNSLVEEEINNEE